MQLLDKSEVHFQWDDLLAHEIRVPTLRARSKGVHASDVLKYLYFGSLPPALEPKEKVKKMQEASEELGEFDPTIMPLRMIMGMGWENHLMGFMQELSWQPEELKRDGISGSPDAYGKPQQVHEIKLTWKSCRDRNEGANILKETLWIWQLKSYLAIKGWVHGVLHVGYVNGDYRHPFQPRYFKYLIEFEEEELESFWQRAIVPNREKAMRWKAEQGRS